MSETPEQLLARLLRCPKVKAATMKVARSKGVPADEQEDVYQETCARLSAATLPTVEADARRYINGVARFVAVDLILKKNEEPTESLEALDGEARVVQPRVEQRTYLKALLAEGYRKFGRSFEWFVRSKVHQETSQEIGATDGVTPATSATR